MGQLIYIEQKDKDEATRLLKGFAHEDKRKKAFINSLGAELVMKYLAQEGVNTSNVYNLHNIFRLREEFELADVMLPNIHIDVRMIYDENLIFVPKSHFEYDLTPDIYVVLKTSQDGSYVDFLGFFEPGVIDKTKQNEEYYFIDKSRLQSPDKFISYVRAFNGNTTQETDLSEEISRYAMSLADNDISEQDKKELLSFLKKSASLREEMIEFDNFEWLSYTLTHEDSIEKNFNKTVDEFDSFNADDEFSLMDGDNATKTTEEADLIAGMDNIEELPVDESAISTDLDSQVVDDSLALPEASLSEPELEVSAENLEVGNLEVSLPQTESTGEETGTTAEVSSEETSEANLEEISEISDALPSDENSTNEEQSSGEFVDLSALDGVENGTDSLSENSADDSLVSFDDLETALGEEQNTQNTEDVVELENLTSLDDLLSVSDGVDAVMSESADFEPVEISHDVPDKPQTAESPSEKTSASYENSTVISNDSPVEGEIPIDINLAEEKEPIGVLYNEKPDNNIGASTSTPEKGQKGILVVAAVAAVLAIGGVAGYFSMSGNQNDFDNDISTAPENIVPPEDVLENPLPEDAVEPKSKKVKKEKSEDDLIQKAKSLNKTAIETDYLEVRRLSWAVPDYVSYNEAFRKYLQAVSKSLKLALSSDLLSATEYPYSNLINVDIEMSKAGSLMSCKISKSSGSEQIDKIVLQTVKETMVVVKVPSGVIVGDKIMMTLKINL